MTHPDQFQNLNRLGRDEGLQWIECEGCLEDREGCPPLKIINDDEEV